MTAQPLPARVLVADPPWKFRDKLPGAKRGAEKHYPCLSVEELQNFPLPPIADDALLFLWRVASMPLEAPLVCLAWGFEPKSEIVWVKGEHYRDSDPLGTPPRLAFGMGRYVRGAHETCLIARRGRGKVRSHALRSVFFAPRQEHSRKPDVFYDIVEELAEGPYVEMFARRPRVGWQSFGDELDPPT